MGMRAHARRMRGAAGEGPLRAIGKGHPSRPGASPGARMPLHGWSSRKHRRILADAFVMLLNTTRGHVCSRSGRVNMGCVITHMSLSSRVFTSGLIPLHTHVTETRHAGAANWEQRHVHRPMRAHARRMRRAADAGPLPANGRARPGHPDAAHGPACRRMGSTCILLSKSALLGPCGPMRGPCGARLARARCGPTGGGGPAARAPRRGPACRCMGSTCILLSKSALLGPCGPMRGACEARLAWARCGPSGEVIPAARAPRLGPACRCMAGAPASIAALADAFVVLLSTTRGHVCSRSGHVNTKRIRWLGSVTAVTLAPFSSTDFGACTSASATGWGFAVPHSSR
jgi:hypothetical protein